MIKLFLEYVSATLNKRCYKIVHKEMEEPATFRVSGGRDNQYNTGQRKIDGLKIESNQIPLFPEVLQFYSASCAERFEIVSIVSSYFDKC